MCRLSPGQPRRELRQHPRQNLREADSEDDAIEDSSPEPARNPDLVHSGSELSASSSYYSFFGLPIGFGSFGGRWPLLRC